MKSFTEIVFLLQHAQEMLEPVIASLHQDDSSELFLAVAPGVAEECYALVQGALRRAVGERWFAGRRGRISIQLMGVLGCLQKALRAQGWSEAARQAIAAAEQLRHVLAALGRMAPVRRR